MDDRKKIFSENLKYYLKKNKRTQSDLAKYLDCSKGSVGDWTSGRSFPVMSTVQRIAMFLGVEISDLIEKRQESPYYVNKEVAEIAQELYDNPEARALFSASRKLSIDDMKAVQTLINSLINKSED